MRNFKRVLSYLLVATMLLGSFSCLGGVFTLGAYAADDEIPTWTDPTGKTYTVGTIGTDAKTHAEAAAAYDATYGVGTSVNTTTYANGIGGTGGWVYLAADCYEIPAAQITNENIKDYIKDLDTSDGYVDAGDYIFTTITMDVSSGLYVGTATLCTTFPVNFFDFINSTANADNLGIDGTDTDLATFAAKMNTDNAFVQSAQAYCQVSPKTTVYTSGVAGQTGLSQTQLESLAGYNFGSKAKTTTVFQTTSSTNWYVGFLLQVKSDLEDGTTGAIYAQPELYKSADNIKPNGNVNLSYKSGTAITAGKMLYAKAGTTTIVNATLILDDFGCCFCVGEAPDDEGGGGGDAPDAVNPGSWTDPTGKYTFPTGTIGTDAKTHAEAADAYDATYGVGTSVNTTTYANGIGGTGGWVYLAADCYEIPAAQITNENIKDYIKDLDTSDGYVHPGDYIFTTITMDASSGLYVGTATLCTTFPVNFFDFINSTANADNLGIDGTDTDLATFAAKMNTDNAFVQSAQAYCQVSPKTTVYTSGVAGQTGLSQTQLESLAGYNFGSKAKTTTVFQTTSSTNWYVGFLLQVKSDLETGTTGAIYAQPELYKSAANIKPNGNVNLSYKSGTAITAGKMLYAKAGTTTIVNATLILDDFGCSFIIGSPKSGGGGTTYTATFYDADNSSTFATQTGVTSATAPTTTPTAPAGQQFAGWATVAGGTVVTFPYTLTANTSFYPVFEAQQFTLTVTYTGAGSATPAVHTESVAAGDSYSVATPAVTGYTADKTVVSGIMPANDVNVTVTYTANSHYLTINYTGAGTSNPAQYKQSYAYGASYNVASPTVTGYTANKTAVTGTMGDADVTVTVTYTANKYKITYYKDGTQYAQDTYAYGAAVTARPLPTETGKTFTAWSPAVPQQMPANNVDVYTTSGSATYVLTISYVGAGSATPAQYTANVAYGTAYNVASPTVTGYTPDVAVVTGTMGAAAVNITVTYTVNSYKTYYMDGDTQIDVFDTNYGAIPQQPATPTKAGYTFAGWDPDVAAQPASDVTYNATWTEADGVAYTVKTYTMGTDGVYGAAVTATKYGRTGDAVDAASATLENGFYYDTAKAGYAATGTIAANGSTVLTVYVARRQYKLTFIYEGQAGTPVDTYYGAAITAPNADIKTGYTFTEWTPFVPSVMPAADSTYTAQYTIKKYTLTVNYTGLDAADAQASNISKVEYNATYSVASPEVDGYTVENGKATVTGTMPANDLTLSVAYNKNTYTVTYMVDGEEFTTQTYAFRAAITAPANNPDVTGKTFTGWKNLPATMPARDITVTANFGTNAYTFKYIVNGKETSAEYNYGAAIPTTATPTKEGYTFTGWKDADGIDAQWPATMPANDLTLTAQFSVNSYKVTFNVDGALHDQKTFKYGAEIIAADEPSKTGYTFKSWNPKLPATMPAKDLAVEALFTVNSYNAIFTIDGENKVVSTEFGAVPVAPAAAKTGYTFDGWFVTGDATETVVDLAAMTEAGAAYTAKFTVKQFTVTFNGNDGLYGTEATASFTGAYGAAIVFPDEPTRNGYVFDGYDSDITTVPAEDVTINAQWKQDMSFCRIQNVTRVTENYYKVGYATYTVEVKGSPIKIQFCPGGDTLASWTFDRNSTKIMPTENTNGVVSVVDNGLTGDDLVETWTVRTTLPENDYKVRAKVDYTANSWEAVETAYDFTNTYDIEPKPEEYVDPIKSVTVSTNSVVRGDSVVWTVVADDAVTLIQLRDTVGNANVAYTKSLSNVQTVSEGGLTTWTITARMTYADDTLAEKEMTYDVRFRCEGDLAWTESEVAPITVKITKYVESVITEESKYDPYTIISATSEGGEQYAYTTITINTTVDITKVRITVGGKRATYTPTSNNLVYTANTDGETATWEISYRFTTAGTNPVVCEVRGTAWTGVKTNLDVEIA